MNEGVHFFTGYLIFMGFLNHFEKNSAKQVTIKNFLLFYGGFAGLIPDLMEYPFFGLGHGTWTHTILFGSVLSIFVTTLMYVLAKPEFNENNISYVTILFIAWIATMSHLILDIGTHTKFDCLQAEIDMRHIYFWPLWNQSFHLDCLFGWSYTARIIIEWVICIPILIGMLIWRLKKCHENPFIVFNMKTWWGIKQSEKKMAIRLILIPIFLYGFVIAYIITYFI